MGSFTPNQMAEVLISQGFEDCSDEPLIDKNNVVTITPMYRDEFSSLCERVEKEESEMNKHE